jgi:hypothetical protein
VVINSDGEVKVFCRWTLPDEETNYRKALEDREPAYLGRHWITTQHPNSSGISKKVS